MKFDDDYLLKLSVRISDFQTVNKLKNKVKQDEKIYNTLAQFCKDERVYKLFSNKTYKKADHLLLLFKNPFDNSNIIQNYLSSEKIKADDFHNDDSAVLCLMRNQNNLKKII